MAKQNPLKSKLEKRDAKVSGKGSPPKEEKGYIEESYVKQVDYTETPKREKSQSSFLDKVNKRTKPKEEEIPPTFDLREDPITPEYEEDYETEYVLSERKKARKEARLGKAKKIGTIIMAVLCMYLVFTIFGAINTEYVYDENGNVVPQEMTISRKKALAEFETVALQYRQARALYEKVLLLDYRVGAGIEAPMEVAPEYDAMLQDIEKLNIQINAVNVSAEYNQVLAKLYDWTFTDLPVYCQSISKAIQQNDEESANKALAFRDAMYSDFSKVTQILLSLSERVEGSNVTDIVEWSPQNYISEATGGI